jgi:hypothetical protein
MISGKIIAFLADIGKKKRAFSPIPSHRKAAVCKDGGLSLAGFCPPFYLHCKL